MKTLRNLVEEAKRQTAVVFVSVFAVAYLMTLPSSSLWLNLPVALFVVAAVRHLSLELDIRWKSRGHEAENLSVREAASRHRQSRSRGVFHGSKDSSRNKWKKGVDSPAVEAAIEELTENIVNEWVLQLWFSSLSTDQEVPEEIRLLINGVMGEVAQRAKKVNLITLLTKDLVDLVASHLELFRKTQARVGLDILLKLSSEQRDEKLKQSLVASRELHPALVSPEAEYMVLRRLIGEVVELVLRPQDKQNRLVLSLARELLACAVVRPVVNLVNPIIINQLIESRIQASKNKVHIEQPLKSTVLNAKVNKLTTSAPDGDPSLEMAELSVVEAENSNSQHSASAGKHVQARPVSNAEKPQGGFSKQKDLQETARQRRSGASKNWTRASDLTVQKRSQALAPEHLDAMWTKGRNYNKKEAKTISPKVSQLVPIAGPTETEILETAEGPMEESVQCPAEPAVLALGTKNRIGDKASEKDSGIQKIERKKSVKVVVQKSSAPNVKGVKGTVGKLLLEDQDDEDVPGIGFAGAKASRVAGGNSSVGSQTSVTPLKVSEAKKHPLSFLEDLPRPIGSVSHLQIGTQSLSQHRRSKSISEFEGWQDLRRGLDRQDGSWNSSKGSDMDVLNPNVETHSQASSRPFSEKTCHEPVSPSKFRCKVIGYHVFKDVSRPFVAYTISVIDSLDRIWKVQRRYRNFEQLHRRLKEIPHYDLNLPPKRYLSSNMDDAFILERCALLDGYLQELLSRPSISEQHEVWDFLSVNSVNYGFSNSESMMKTIAGNVDDAVDDVFRQIRGVSDDLQEVFKTATTGIKKRVTTTGTSEVVSSVSFTQDLPQALLLSEAAYGERGLAAHVLDDEMENMGNSPPQAQFEGAFSDSEVPSRQSVQSYQAYRDGKGERALSEGHSPVESLQGSDTVDEDLGIPQEWAPPKLSVPLLNLVDVVFQLQGRGWLRRQVFWIAKEALQLIMGGTMDEWLLNNIQWLRKEDSVAAGISWLRGFLWRDGLFITKRNGNNATPRANTPPGYPQPLTFEQQREAARRKQVVREVMLDRAPITLVGLIGGKQYQRCVRDIYHFIQSALFMKQLSYSLLEILILAAFPELHDVVLDVRSSVL